MLSPHGGTQHGTSQVHLTNMYRRRRGMELPQRQPGFMGIVDPRLLGMSIVRLVLFIAVALI